MVCTNFCCCLVISAPPVVIPLYYSPSPVSVDPSMCGSVSPARKAASVLEPSPGTKHTDVDLLMQVMLPFCTKDVWLGGSDFSCIVVGEKRKPTEPLHHEENKRPRVLGDIPMDLINEVMATIADPAAIPEVIV